MDQLEISSFEENKNRSLFSKHSGKLQENCQIFPLSPPSFSQKAGAHLGHQFRQARLSSPMRGQRRTARASDVASILIYDKKGLLRMTSDKLTLTN